MAVQLCGARPSTHCSNWNWISRQGCGEPFARSRPILHLDGTIKVSLIIAPTFLHPQGRIRWTLHPALKELENITLRVFAAAIPAVVAEPKLAFDAQAGLHSERHSVSLHDRLQSKGNEELSRVDRNFIISVWE